jgi:hypothetical protein
MKQKRSVNVSMGSDNYGATYQIVDKQPILDEQVGILDFDATACVRDRAIVF